MLYCDFSNSSCHFSYAFDAKAQKIVQHSLKYPKNITQEMFRLSFDCKDSRAERFFGGRREWKKYKMKKRTEKIFLKTIYILPDSEISRLPSSLLLEKCVMKL